MMTESELQSNKYLISYPEGFDPAKKYPLIIFLHGAGTRSPDTTILRKNAGFLKLRNFQYKQFLLLAPLCSASNWNEVMQSLIGLVDQIRHMNCVDIRRVTLTGNSMGGYGTWELASLRPDWFAAIMPLCGGGIPWMAYTLKDIPIRAFHGLKDPTVDPIESLEMAKAVNRHGGYADLILFPDLDHNCWDRVYSTEANTDWLLQFSLDRDKSLVQQLSGSAFG